MYIEIDGVEYPCEVATTISQMGNTVIRVISEEAPVAENGFILKSGDKEFDRSSFKYLYRMDGNVKEYTEVAEEIIPASGYVSGIPENPLAKQLSAMNQRIADLTPYKEIKSAGIQDKECVFDGSYKDGVLTATVVTDKGEQKPCKIERSADNITVRFEELTEVATLTIQIQ